MLSFILSLLLFCSSAKSETELKTEIPSSRFELTSFSFNIATETYFKTSNFLLSNYVYHNFIAGPLMTIDYHTANNKPTIGQYGLRVGLRNIVDTDLLNLKADLRYLIHPGVIQSYQVGTITSGIINFETLSILELSKESFWYTFNQLYTYFYKNTLATALVFGSTLNNSFVFEELFVGPGVRAIFDSSDILLSMVFGSPEVMSVVAYLNVRIF